MTVAQQITAFINRAKPALDSYGVTQASMGAGVSRLVAAR
jgi:hypothetical protein